MSGLTRRKRKNGQLLSTRDQGLLRCSQHSLWYLSTSPAVRPSRFIREGYMSNVHVPLFLRTVVSNAAFFVAVPTQAGSILAAEDVHALELGSF